MIAVADQIQRIRKYWEPRGVLKSDDQFGLRGHMDKAATVYEDTRELEFIVNTDDVDADSEIVVPAGLDFSQFRKNGKVFLDHWYDFDHTIGALRWVKPYPDARNVRGWSMRMSIVAGLRNPLADDVLTAAKAIGIGASIGFIPRSIEPPAASDPERYKGARAIIRSASVFEVSLTMLPANLSCQQVTAEMSDDEYETPAMRSLGELVTKGRIKPEAAKRLGWQEPKTLKMPRRLRMGV